MLWYCIQSASILFVYGTAFVNEINWQYVQIMDLLQFCILMYFKFDDYLARYYHIP